VMLCIMLEEQILSCCNSVYGMDSKPAG